METKALVPVPKVDLPVRVHEIREEIKARKELISKHFIELGRLFKEVRDNKLWEIDGEDSFNDFIASPEIAFSRSTVYSLIDIYELFILECQHTKEEISKIPWSKLNIIKGSYKKTKNPELLDKAKTNSQKDLIDHIREIEGRDPGEYKPKKEERPFLRIENFGSYQEFVKTYGCLLCGNKNPDPHHFPKTKGAGAPDHWQIPLCRSCHTEWQEKKNEFLITYMDQIFAYFYDIILSVFQFLGRMPEDEDVQP